MGLLILFNNLNQSSGVVAFGTAAPEARKIKAKVEDRVIRYKP